MGPSDWITLAAAIASFILAGISLWAVWGTLQQNKAMLENSTRPYITAMYESVTLPDHEIARYVVIKNFGQSSGTLLDIALQGPIERTAAEQISHLKGVTIAPGQRFLYYFGSANDQAPEILSITMTYCSNSGKSYTETTALKMISGSYKKRAIKTDAIPLILQDISDRLL